MIRRWLELRRLRRAWLRAVAAHPHGQVPMLDSGPDAPAAPPPVGARDWWRAQGDYSHGQVGSDRGHGPFDEIAVGRWLHAEMTDDDHCTLHLAGWRLEVDISPDGHGTLRRMEWDAIGPPETVDGIRVEGDPRPDSVRNLDDLDHLLRRANQREGKDS